MHEASLINALVGKVEKDAASENARRITRVHVWLGVLSHMSSAHFRAHFAHAPTGTVAEGAALEVEVSGDVTDPHAQDLLLKRVEVET